MHTILRYSERIFLLNGKRSINELIYIYSILYVYIYTLYDLYYYVYIGVPCNILFITIVFFSLYLLYNISINIIVHYYNVN